MNRDSDSGRSHSSRKGIQFTACTGLLFHSTTVALFICYPLDRKCRVVLYSHSSSGPVRAISQQWKKIEHASVSLAPKKVCVSCRNYRELGFNCWCATLHAILMPECIHEPHPNPKAIGYSVYPRGDATLAVRIAMYGYYSFQPVIYMGQV